MFELVLRIGFSLLVVFGLMWLLARVLRRPLGSGRRAGTLAVLHRQQLSRGAAVAVIRVADRAMIVGVTDQQVSLLGEADVEDFEPHPPAHRDTAARPGTGVPGDSPGAHPVGLSAGVPGAHPGGLPGAHPGGLHAERVDRSLLSPRTWTSSAMDFLRDRTTRQ